MNLLLLRREGILACICMDVLFLLHEIVNVRRRMWWGVFICTGGSSSDFFFFYVFSFLNNVDQFGRQEGWVFACLGFQRVLHYLISSFSLVLSLFLVTLKKK